MRVLICALGVALVLVSAAAARQDPTIVVNPPEKFTMRVIATGLDGPWEITWGPDQQIWATERRGRRVIRINPADGTRTTLLSLPEAAPAGHCQKQAHACELSVMRSAINRPR